MIQVDHIKTLFTEIQQLRDNGWVEATVATASSGKSQKMTKTISGGARKTSTGNAPRSAKAEEAAKAREEARRKMMEDRRKMMKAASAKTDDQLESFIGKYNNNILWYHYNINLNKPIVVVGDKSDAPEEESPIVVWTFKVHENNQTLTKQGTKRRLLFSTP